MRKLLILFSLLSVISNNSIGFIDIKGNVKNPGVYEIYKNETIQDVIKKAGGLKNNSYTDNINLSKIVKDEMVIYIHSKKEIEKYNDLSNCNCLPIYMYKDCEENIQEENNDIFNFVEEVTSSTTTTKITSKQNITTKPNEIEKPSITSENVTTEISTTKPMESITSNLTTTTTNIISDTTKKININNCNIDELVKLKGLGESKARNIIEYRMNYGLFNSIEDILNVSGIGNKIFENIKDYIEV